MLIIFKTASSIAFCKAIETLSFSVTPPSTSTSSVPSSKNLNRSCVNPTDSIDFEVITSIRISPVDTDTNLTDTLTLSSLYCLLLPIPKYLAPNPPLNVLVS